MCFDTIKSYYQEKAHIASLKEQFKYEQERATQAQKAALNQHSETLARMQLDKQRQALATLDRSQQAQVQARKNQATAVASASSAGLTQLPLAMLNNQYQAAVGNISANLNETYKQLNENAWLGGNSSRMQTQSTINQYQPQPLIYNKTPMWMWAMQANAELGAKVANAFGIPASGPKNQAGVGTSSSYTPSVPGTGQSDFNPSSTGSISGQYQQYQNNVDSYWNSFSIGGGSK